MFELNKIYEAFVDDSPMFARLYFMFDDDFLRVFVHDSYDVDWCALPVLAEVVHNCSHGTWCFHLDKREWRYSRQGVLYTPTITVADDKNSTVKAAIHGKMKGKHYDAIIEDDMPSIVSSPDSIKKCVKAYAKIMAKYPTPIFTNITEGGNEMTKRLYHVILFNRKTEEIDFKEYVPAAEASDAMMTAAQTYGKYDANIHMTIIKEIENSSYNKVE